MLTTSNYKQMKSHLVLYNTTILDGPIHYANNKMDQQKQVNLASESASFIISQNEDNITRQLIQKLPLNNCNEGALSAWS